MVETLLEDVREHIAESSKHIDHAKDVLNDACDGFLHKSKRAVKAGRDATDDLVDYAERSVKKYPKSSMASTMVVGIALGFAVGWMLARRD
jgi:ElaB/YqjD/DUF883 family membrane-anchored ribosome-binding protein